MRRARAWLAGGALAVLASSSVTRGARADERGACVTASEEGQTLRDDGELRRARNRFATCARRACPAVVRTDCEGWLADVDALQPTVIPAVRDAGGGDIAGARITIDDGAALVAIDGSAIALDPGEHVLRYAAPGVAPTELRLIVRIGEKNRAVTLVTRVAEAVQRVEPRLVPAAVPAEQARPGPHPLAFVLPAVGGAALGAFVYFGLSGRSTLENLRATCAPRCDAGEVDAARMRLVLADVWLGVGLTAIAGAVWLVLSGGEGAGGGRLAGTGAPARVEVSGRHGGGVGSVSVAF